MFDTHCHLNFKAFKKTLPEVITRAHEFGVTHIVIPGTDVKTSQRAVEIASENENIYAAVGIHPHHVYELLNPQTTHSVDGDLKEVEDLLANPKVVAVGEIGLDRHVYEATKYESYNIDERFMELQKELFRKQVMLAISHDKSLILHNREAKHDLLPILREIWDSKLEGRAVFHCCEPDEELLEFAKDHKMFIGVDGDITYREDKQTFVKQIPLEMLVLETDSPFLLPEPLRTEKKYPNTAANIPLIAEFIAKIVHMSQDKLGDITAENGKKLFGLTT